MGNKKHYSIWAMPTGHLAEELQDCISDLALEYGGPVFPPHVTILGGIPSMTEEEIKQKTKLLTETLHSYDVHFDELGSLDQFFRCIFIKMKNTPDVLHVFEEACKIFGYVDYETHMSHLSIFYGNLTESVRLEAMKRIHLHMNRSFRVSALHIFETDSDIAKWRKIAEFPLT